MEVLFRSPLAFPLAGSHLGVLTVALHLGARNSLGGALGGRQRVEVEPGVGLGSMVVLRGVAQFCRL